MDFSRFLAHPVVDVRTAEQYATSHFKNSANFPMASLESRVHELPSNQIPISIFGRAEELVRAVQLLESKNYHVAEQLAATDEFLLELKSMSICEQGSRSARLWQPASVVEWFFNNVELNSNCSKGLDLACGAGRDSLYLARRGWNMTAVDYSTSALQKIENYSNTDLQTTSPISTRSLDLEKHTEQLSKLLGTYDAIIVVRYLHRPLLEQFQLMLNQNGYIVYQTFLVGCEAYGSPKNPRFLLKPGELSNVFSEFEVLLDDIEYLADGRPTNRFIARKT
jgi:SAM-dependent methyltransferase